MEPEARARMAIYPQAILGYRGFLLRDGHLCSLVQETFWRSGVNAAKCVFHSEHQPPVRECSCGFYAYHMVQSAIGAVEAASELKQMMPEAMLLAAVAGRGRTEIHSQGWRAQEAQIIALGDVLGSFSDERLQDLGTLYEVPAFKSVHRLQYVATGYAKPVDPQLLPDEA